MNAAIIRTEIRKITARRGSFYGAAGIAWAVSLATFVTSLIVRSTNNAVVSGTDALEVHSILFQVAAVSMITVAASVGAWDVSNGTFRYMAMTGRSRLTMYLARIPAILVVVVAVIVPMFVLAIVQAYAIPLDPGDDTTRPGGRDIAAFLWNGIFTVGVWSLLAMGVGALLRSNGAGIGFAAGLFLGGSVLMALIAAWREDVAQWLINWAMFVVAFGPEEDESLTIGIIAVVLWLGVILGAGAYRTVDAEY